MVRFRLSSTRKGAISEVLFQLLTLAVALAATPLTAPITHVTVFGDRARVVRTAALPPSNAAPIEVSFPILPDGVDRDSIRVAVQSGSLGEVQIVDVPETAIPLGPGRALLGQIEALDDQLWGLGKTREATQSALDRLRSVAPQTQAPSDHLPPRPLEPSGWSAATAFLKGTEASLREQQRQLMEKETDLIRQRQKLAEQAAELGAVAHPRGTLVRAMVHGGSQATLSYEVPRATWAPRYDVQLDPEKNEARVSLAGIVTQATGEDWTDAALVLSTAIPSTARMFEELPVWKIGERERFIPMPKPYVVPPARAPAAPPLERKADEGADLRSQLLRAISQATPQAANSRHRAEFDGRPPPSATTTTDFEDVTIEGDLMKSQGVSADDRGGPPNAAPPPAPPPPSVIAEPPASAPRFDAVASEFVARGTFKPLPPATQLALGPPIHFEPPALPPGSPAALAGGYDLSYPSLRPETVPSGSGSRRIALFSRTFPISLTRAIYPGLTEAVFLVAELSNPSADPLPAGAADLFVGDDPSGSARLPLVAPGERFTLPLGLDRAIRPVRRVELVQGESGVFSKEDVRQYQVTIELANPNDQPIDVHLFDQWPVTRDAHVQVALGEVDPHADSDPVTGKLEWRMSVPAAGKRVVRFSFTVRCPKGWRLQQ